ncbi:protein disulfide isomerase, DsbG family [Campylobacter blaseri]|uniref:Disulfide isomerase DsbG N-terminal domain-containing protein n=1 Tax=Campylobacter blaseri TaxID=2042961 RepID=A0A2P8QYS3_9BACT|nr:hypothetical protein [Campylobacter blaseri]PSM51391.1 hypothetical protein CQ405_08355 [Campylobacter blaseri]PSM52841.1 hypothetical protein CRN67_08360 [Campylobacter blaseri]QKF86143.1 protein disulfide isomerase, DsbG family [Campylobacter blaseri]
MKKFYLPFLIAAMCQASGIDFEKNLKNTIENNYKNIGEVEIVSSDKLKSINGLNLVVFNIKNANDSLAIFSSDDGKTIFPLPNNIVFGDKGDEDLVLKKISNLEQEKRKYQEKVAYEIIKKIPEERFLTIQSFDKNNKFTMYMITDPECPHCRNEIDRLSKWVRNAHLKILFAPVHGESARAKSALMLKEGRKLKSNDQESLIKLLEKYYDENAVVEKDATTEEERNLVLQDAKKIFSKGVVKGVPFTFVVEE